MKKLAGVAVMALAAAYCIDRWDTYGGNIIHHIANMNDLELAMAMKLPESCGRKS
jgi:hypothetical protein